MDIITTAELASYLDDASANSDRGDLIVGLANSLATEAVGTLDPIPAKVRTVVFEVAGRAFRNPDGYASETVDDYSYRLPNETRAAGVYLTPSESATLRASVAVVAEAYSVDLGTLP